MAQMKCAIVDIRYRHTSVAPHEKTTVRFGEGAGWRNVAVISQQLFQSCVMRNSIVSSVCVAGAYLVAALAKRGGLSASRQSCATVLPHLLRRSGVSKIVMFRSASTFKATDSGIDILCNAVP
jgi:hypothetical protein